MNEITYKISGRGAHVVRKWDEISKAGGEAPSPNEVLEYLKGKDSIQLTREEVQERAFGYLISCMEEYTDEDTNETGYRWRKNPTKAGLARAIGVTPETLSRYASNHRIDGDAYAIGSKHSVVSTNDFDIIQAAYCVIEEFYESQLGKNRNNSGSIFWLLNAKTERWTNKQEVEMINNDSIQIPTLSQDCLLYTARCL